MHRIGKIARLPEAVREQLNQRLADNQPGAPLLEWLNALPETQAILRKEFGGAPLTKQNLSAWRLGGFRDWQIRRDLLAHASALRETSAELAKDLDAPLLAGHLAAVLAARHAAILNTWDGEPDPKITEQLRVLRVLCQDVAQLQRTLQLASKHQDEVGRQRQAAEKAAHDEARDKALGPIWSAMSEGPLSRIFGGGEDGVKLAQYVNAFRFGTPMPKWDDDPAETPAKPAPKPAASAPAQTAPAVPPAPSEVKAGQAQSRQQSQPPRLDTLPPAPTALQTPIIVSSSPGSASLSPACVGVSAASLVQQP